VRRRRAVSVVAVAVSIAWGMVVAVSAYALMRTIQVLLSPDANPAEVAWSVHAGYIWRVLSVAYGGTMVAFVVLLIARRRVEGCLRALGPALVVAAALLALQALLFP
jgi:hypothetical protein